MPNTVARPEGALATEGMQEPFTTNTVTFHSEYRNLSQRMAYPFVKKNPRRLAGINECNNSSIKNYRMEHAFLLYSSISVL